MPTTGATLQDIFLVTASGIHIHGVNLHKKSSLNAVVAEHAGREVAFAMAFPPCTELSRAGARYWKVKGQADPHFQDNAAALVKRVDSALTRMNCPYFMAAEAASELSSTACVASATKLLDHLHLLPGIQCGREFAHEPTPLHPTRSSGAPRAAAPPCAAPPAAAGRRAPWRRGPRRPTAGPRA